MHLPKPESPIENTKLVDATLWSRLERSGNISEEKLCQWGNYEAWAVVDGAQGRWQVELRCPWFAWTLDSPCKVLHLHLSKHQVSPAKPDAKLILRFDACDPECRRIWPHLAEDVVSEIAKAPDSRPDGMIKALRNWKLFWPREKERFGPAFLQGLFGELCLIRWFLENDISPERTLKGWTGPSRQFHDFRFQHCHVEVKSNAKKRRIVTIPNLRQLDETSAGTLFLAHLRLAKVRKKECSLAALVEAIDSQLTDLQKNLFAEKLRISRWFQILKPLRDKTMFHTEKPEFYCVKEGFPRLLEKDLKQSVFVTSYNIELPAINGGFTADPKTVLDLVG